MKNEAMTSTGATNSAIWRREPIAMLTARSILSLQRDQHRDPVLGGVADDRDDDHPDEELAEADRLGGLGDRADQDLRHHTDGDAGDRQHQIERRTLQPKRGSSSSSWGGLKRSRWVRSENSRPAT